MLADCVPNGELDGVAAIHQVQSAREKRSATSASEAGSYEGGPVIILEGSSFQQQVMSRAPGFALPLAAAAALDSHDAGVVDERNVVPDGRGQ